MSFDARRNFAMTTVTVAPSPADTGLTLTVKDASEFDAPPFNVTVCPAFLRLAAAREQPNATNATILRITGVSGNVLTFLREQEGSANRVIQVGDQIFQGVTDKSLADIEAAVTAEIARAKKAEEERLRAISLYQFVTGEPDGTHRTTNLKGAVEAMEATGLPLWVPQDGYYYVPNSEHITLNKQTAIPGSGDAAFRYIFMGAGTIELPPGMSSGDSLLLRELTSSGEPIEGAFGDAPRVVVRDVRAVGGESPQGTFLSTYNSGVRLDDVRFRELLYGLRQEGGSDSDYINVSASEMTPGGWVVSKVGGGDGCVIRGKFYACAGVNLTSVKGGRVEALVSGWHKFRQSDLVIDAVHIEGDAPGAGVSTEPLLTSEGSRLYISEGDLYTSVARLGAVLINDENGTNGRESSITFGKELYFNQRLDDPGSSHGDRLGTAVYISNSSQRTTLAFQGGGTQRTFAQDATGSQEVFGHYAPLVKTANTTSEDKAIQTALTAAPLRPGMDVELRRRNGVWGWSVPDPLSAIRTTRRVTANGGVISVAAEAATPAGVGPGWSNIGTTGKVFYRLWTADPDARTTIPTASMEVTLGVNKIPKLTIDTFIAPTMLIVERATEEGVWAKVIELPLARGTIELWDQGDAMGGIAWSTSSLPTAPTVNTTYDGTVTAARIVIYGEAVPTAGSWPAGARLVTPTGEYICATAGEPGVWVPVEPVSDTVSSLTRNSAGQVTEVVSGVGAVTQTISGIVRNSSGQITSYKLNGVTHAITRNASGQVTAVS